MIEGTCPCASNAENPALAVAASTTLLPMNCRREVGAMRFLVCSRFCTAVREIVPVGRLARKAGCTGDGGGCRDCDFQRIINGFVASRPPNARATPSPTADDLSGPLAIAGPAKGRPQTPRSHTMAKTRLEFTAFPRAGEGGRGASRRLRHEGKTPGIVYGGADQPAPIELDHNALIHALKNEAFHSSILTMQLGNGSQRVLLRDVQMHPYRPQVLHIDFQRIDELKNEAFHSSILTMQLGNGSQRVLLRDVQMHPYRPQVLHIDFQRIDENKKIHMKVPLHFVNADVSPAVKLGGAIISHVLNELDIACLPKNLPEFILVDLSTIEIGHSIKVSDLKLDEGVLAITRGKDPVVAAAVVPKIIVEAEETAAAEGEALATTAVAATT